MYAVHQYITMPTCISSLNGRVIQLLGWRYSQKVDRATVAAYEESLSLFGQRNYIVCDRCIQKFNQYFTDLCL